MNTNPARKPAIVTEGLLVASALVGVGLTYAAAMSVAAGAPPGFLLLPVAGLLLTALILGLVWRKRIKRRKNWLHQATARWEHFEDLRRTSGVTAEVTVLRINVVQPTGAWITIRWNRFNHVQPAWLQVLPQPIWPGTVLLITPDPWQIHPAHPWPDTYYIRADHCLAFAPEREFRPIIRAPNRR